MATPELAPVGADRTESSAGLSAGGSVGRSSARRTLGLVGQYALLTALAVLVLGPIFLTGILAMSPPFTYVARGKPLHPVVVNWKDRTWFTGGALSVVVRTLVVLAFYTWFQKVAARVTWRSWRSLLRPVALVGSVGATVALTVLAGPAFASLRDADGASQWWVVAAMAVVAACLVPGLVAGGRRLPWAVAGAVAVAVLSVGAAIVFVGGAVWTQAWGSAQLGPAMRQSLKMAILITVLQVVTSITSAYAFVFLRFPLKRLLFALFMATLLLPLEVTLVGNVALIRQLGWINTTQGLVLPFAATALGTFLIRQGFRGIPPEIQDATRLDGYGHIAFLTKFAVPLTRPVIAAFTVISALGQ